MPLFRTKPMNGLTASIRNLIAGAGQTLNPLQEIQADQAAAETAQKLSLVEKARLEAEALRREQAAAEEAERIAPQRRTEFAAHSAGIDLPDATRLYKAISGARERPAIEFDDEGNLMPDVTFAKPESVAPGQERLFRSALAAAQANLLGTGKTNAEQLTGAAGNVQTQALVQAVQDAIGKGDLNTASAISQGAKPGTQIKLHENIGTTGATFAPATGDVAADPAADPANKVLAGTVTELAAKAEREKAAAAASRAQASLDTAKTQNEKSKEGQLGKPPPGYRWGPADEDGAPTLIPISGGPAEKLGETQVKQLVGVQNTRAAIQEYRNAIKNFGLLDMANPNARARMGTIYNNMMLQTKEAYNLGVLNGPDYEILTSVVTDPTSLKAGVISSKALDAQAKKLDEIMGRIGLNVAAASRQRKPGAPGGDGWGIRRLP